MPTFWIITAVWFVVMLGVTYWVGRYLFGHEAAARRLPLIGVILVFSIVIAVALRAPPYGWGDRAWIALGLTGPLLFFGHLITRGKRQRQAGAVLMDLGRDRASLIAWIAFFLAALLSLVEIPSQSGETIRLVSEEMFFLFYGGHFLLMWYDGRQLREGGFLSQGALFRWDKIQRYDWKGGRTLSLSLNRRWPFSRVPVLLRISSDQKEAVDQILRERLQIGKQF